MVTGRIKELQERNETSSMAQERTEERLSTVRDFDVRGQKTDAESIHKQALELENVSERETQEPRNERQEKRFDRARDLTHPSRRDLSEKREKKGDIVEHMVAKDFPLSPEKRLDNAKDFHYRGDREFGEELGRRDLSSTESDIRRTDGFYDKRDNQAFVRENDDTLLNSIHEKLHQKSRSELPTRLNEGITEHYARQEAGPAGNLRNLDHRGGDTPKAPSDYENEVIIVRKLESTVGDTPFKKAYFEGQTDALKHSVDAVLGDGAFQKISDALEQRDYKAASDILEKYYRR